MCVCVCVCVLRRRRRVTLANSFTLSWLANAVKRGNSTVRWLWKLLLFPYRFDRNKYKIIRSTHNPPLIAHTRRVLVEWSVYLTFVSHCCCRSNFCVKCLTHIIDRNYKNIIFPTLLHNMLTTTWRPYSATSQ